MYASVILGKVVAQALEANDYSQEALWGYNVEYMTTHGYQMASFEVLRRYLQTLTNEQINYGMKHFLSEEDVRAIGERRHPDFNRAQMINPILLLRALSEYELAKGLRYTAKKSQTLVEHNLAYPTSPKGFADWRKTLLEGDRRDRPRRFKPIEVAELDAEVSRRRHLGSWKELNPSGAYLLGWDEYAGTFFIPSEQNIKDALEKVRALRRRAENDVQAKVLDSMEVGLLAPRAPARAGRHRRGIDIRPPHEGGGEREAPDLSHAQPHRRRSTRPRSGSRASRSRPAVKALTLYRLDGILEILDSVKGATKSKKLKEDCDRLAEKVKKFVEFFELEGFGQGHLRGGREGLPEAEVRPGQGEVLQGRARGRVRLQRDPRRARAEGSRRGLMRSSPSTGTS